MNENEPKEDDVTYGFYLRAYALARAGEDIKRLAEGNVSLTHTAAITLGVSTARNAQDSGKGSEGPWTKKLVLAEIAKACE